MRLLPMNILIFLWIFSMAKACWPRFHRPHYGTDPSKPPEYASVDCGETGTFSLAPPYNRRFWKLPLCPDKIRPIYTLHTKSTRDKGEEIGYNPWSIPSEFDPSRRTVFLTHGFHDSTDKDWIRDFIKELLNAEDLNVVTIDWRNGANVGKFLRDGWYDLPASNTRTVGAHAALVMRHLVDIGKTKWEHLWCMGHSLGAHVCGLAGMEAREKEGGGLLGRVTGFDPAGVGFNKSPDLTVGINPTSAKFVDIIHTTTLFGTKRTLGHMDFYPSDGDFQNGCGISGICGHSRSEKYFRESIETDCFVATEICTDFNHIPKSCSEAGGVVAKMGFRANVSGQHGIYRLGINRRSPFCKG